VEHLGRKLDFHVNFIDLLDPITEFTNGFDGRLQIPSLFSLAGSKLPS